MNQIPPLPRSRGVPTEDVLPGPLPGTLLIPLSKGIRYAVIDDADFDLVRGVPWQCEQSQSGKWYARAWFWFEGRKRSVRMHRLLLNAGPGELTDHKDGDGLNNRRTNIRIATYSQNNANRKGYGKSAFLGVSPSKRGRWQVSIRGKNGSIFVGRFATEIEAAREYDRAAREIHGEFAHLNFPNEHIV